MKQKIIKSGSSLVVVIPSSFVKQIGIKKGDIVEVNANKFRGSLSCLFHSASQQLTLLQDKKQVRGS